MQMFSNFFVKKDKTFCHVLFYFVLHVENENKVYIFKNEKKFFTNV